MNRANYIIGPPRIKEPEPQKLCGGCEILCRGVGHDTRARPLMIGRITMQHKGGGRDTAKMLQFKINPVLSFEAK